MCLGNGGEFYHTNILIGSKTDGRTRIGRCNEVQCGKSVFKTTKLPNDIHTQPTLYSPHGEANSKSIDDLLRSVHYDQHDSHWLTQLCSNLCSKPRLDKSRFSSHLAGNTADPVQLSLDLFRVNVGDRF